MIYLRYLCTTEALRRVYYGSDKDNGMFVFVKSDDGEGFDLMTVGEKSEPVCPVEISIIGRVQAPQGETPVDQELLGYLLGIYRVVSNEQ